MSRAEERDGKLRERLHSSAELAPLAPLAPSGSPLAAPLPIQRKARSAPAMADELPPASWSFGEAVSAGIVQRNGGGMPSEGVEHLVQRAAASAGDALPSPLRDRFEASLGADLSGVRIHTDGAAADAADALGARAYAIGQDVFMGANQYAPDTSSGAWLLAHEVAHTAQQAGGRAGPQLKLAVSAPGDAAEHEADRAADAMIVGRPAAVSGIDVGVARQVESRCEPATTTPASSTPARGPAPAPAPATPHHAPARRRRPTRPPAPASSASGAGREHPLPGVYHVLTSELDANALAELVERQLQARGVNGAFFRQSEGFRRFAANLAAPNHPPLRSAPRPLDVVGPGVRIHGTLALHVRDMEHRRGAGELQTRASHRGGDEVGDDNNDRRADVREHGTRMRTTMGGGFDAGESGGPRGGVESEYEQHRRREVTTERGHAHHQQHEEEGISEGRGVVRQAQVTAKVIVTCDLVIERTEISTGPGEIAQFAAPPPIHVVTEVGTIVYATGEGVLPGGGRVGGD